jgi:hypothetical protein
VVDGVVVIERDDGIRLAAAVDDGRHPAGTPHAAREGGAKVAARLGGDLKLVVHGRNSRVRLNARSHEPCRGGHSQPRCAEKTEREMVLQLGGLPRQAMDGLHAGRAHFGA